MIQGYTSLKFTGSNPNKAPDGLGDLAYEQDNIRDKAWLWDRIGALMMDIYSQGSPTSFLISGGVVTDDGSHTKVNISAGVGYAPYTIDLGTSNSVPPATAPEDLSPVRVAWGALSSQGNINTTGTWYVKMAYAEADWNTRIRAKAGGSWVFSKKPSYTLTINTTPPTSYEILLATIVGNTSPLTITMMPPWGATSAANPTSLILRDASGRAKVADPSDTADVATKRYVDNKYVPPPTIAPGIILMFAGSSIPTGWLLCNGAQVSRSTYSNLFSAIGTTYGAGDGSTTFNIPDIQETVPVGVGTRSSGITTHDVFNLGQFKDDQMQGHWHELDGSNGTSGSSAAVSVVSTKVINTVSSAGTIRSPTNDGTNGNPRYSTTTRTKEMGLNYIIRY
jgi:microcystin-dependent protein